VRYDDRFLFDFSKALLLAANEIAQNALADLFYIVFAITKVFILDGVELEADRGNCFLKSTLSVQERLLDSFDRLVDKHLVLE